MPTRSSSTYQAFYLLEHVGTAEADVPQQIFLGTLVQSAVVVRLGGRGPAVGLDGSPQGVRGRALGLYGTALFVVAAASDFDGFLVGMAIAGLGFGIYMAVDLALVADVLPDGGERAPRTSAC